MPPSEHHPTRGPLTTCVVQSETTGYDGPSDECYIYVKGDLQDEMALRIQTLLIEGEPTAWLVKRPKDYLGKTCLEIGVPRKSSARFTDGQIDVHAAIVMGAAALGLRLVGQVTMPDESSFYTERYTFQA